MHKLLEAINQSGIQKKRQASQLICTLIILVISAVLLFRATQNNAKQEQPVLDTDAPIHRMLAADNMGMFDYISAEQEPFWGQHAYLRQEVSTIQFRSSLEHVPEDAWDVSEMQDGSILAWMQNETLCVAAEGKISPNTDGSWLFSYFTNLKSIDFGGCFNTSGVTNMDAMFIGCMNLTQLDLTCFDTARVVSMRGIFSGCCELKHLDLSGFDFGKVTQATMMFAYCNNLEGLTLPDIALPDGANTEDMFYLCEKLTALASTDEQILQANQNRFESKSMEYLN